MAFQLDYNNIVDSAALPDTAEVLAAARSLLDSTADWEEGKTYHSIVETFWKKIPGEASFYARVSEHDPKDGLTVEELWRAIGVDRALHQKDYISELTTATLLHSFEEGKVEAWNLYYTFRGPIAPRKFDVLLIFDPPTATQREGLIVQLNYRPNEEQASKPQGLQADSVQGKTVAMEQIKELPNGKVEWRTIAQSSGGGNIPIFIQEMSMASKLTDDVPAVQKWLKEHPATAS